MSLKDECILRPRRTGRGGASGRDHGTPNGASARATWPYRRSRDTRDNLFAHLSQKSLTLRSGQERQLLMEFGHVRGFGPVYYRRIRSRISHRLLTARSHRQASRIRLGTSSRRIASEDRSSRLEFISFRIGARAACEGEVESGSNHSASIGFAAAVITRSVAP